MCSIPVPRRCASRFFVMYPVEEAVQSSFTMPLRYIYSYPNPKITTWLFISQKSFADRFSIQVFLVHQLSHHVFPRANTIEHFPSSFKECQVPELALRLHPTGEKQHGVRDHWGNCHDVLQLTSYYRKLAFPRELCPLINSMVCLLTTASPLNSL